MRSRALLPVLLAAPLAASALQDPLPPIDEPLPKVVMELETNAPPLVGGVEFEVGVHFEIPSGWHIYWENPGDTGTATRARLSGPKDYKVRGPLFPGPTRFEIKGGKVDYGYADETVLFFRVTAPKVVAPGEEITLLAEAEWTMGKLGETHPGRGKAEIRLETWGAPVAAPPPRATVLDLYRPLLPQAWRDLHDVSYTWSPLTEDVGQGATYEFEVRVWPANTLEFHPFVVRGLQLVGRTAFGDGRISTLRLTYKLSGGGGKREHPPAPHGLLQVNRRRQTSYYDVLLPPSGAMQR